MQSKKLNFGGGLSKFVIFLSIISTISLSVLCFYSISLERYSKYNPEAGMGGLFLFFYGWIPLGILGLIILILGIVEWVHRGFRLAGLFSIANFLIYLLAWGIMVIANLIG